MPEISDERLRQLEQIERQHDALKADRLRFDISSALSASSVLPEALEDAVASMASKCQVEHDADGRIVKLAIGGREFDSVASAAESFLGQRRYLLKQESPEPKATPQSASALITKGWASETQGKQAAPKPPPKRQAEETSSREYTPHELVTRGWAQPPK